MKHAETPWTITTEFAEIVPFSIVKADDTGGSIADVFGDSMDEAEANAKLIVRAVNSHDALVEAAREVRAEIARLNSVTGQTVFNPAVTELLDAARRLAESE